MDKVKITCLLSFLLTVIAGCASTSPHSASLADDVATPPGNASGCKAVSNLNGLPSMPQFDDVVRDLRTQVVGATGNVVFRESANRGTTYHCDSGLASK
jgi:hypothetical protein